MRFHSRQEQIKDACSPLDNAKIHWNTELELCISKEIRSMNIEKDNILCQYGHPRREIKEIDTWNTQQEMRKNLVWKITTVKPRALPHIQSTNYLEDVI